MKVKLLVFASLSLASIAAPIQAAERYKFRVIEGWQAVADQRFPAEMTAVAGKATMVLSSVDGARWGFLFYGCADTTTPCEFRINDSGGQKVELKEVVATDPYDVGLTRIDATRVRLRCLRASCLVRYHVVEGNPETTVTLLRGKSIELPVGSVIELRLTEDASSATSTR